MKIKITIIFLLISILSVGQEEDSTKIKAIEFAEMLVYSFSSEIFKKQEYNTDLNKEYKLPWKNDFYAEEQFKQALDTLIKNATIKIEKGGFSNYNLRFNSYFPEFIDEGLMDIFKLSVKKSNIDNKGTNLDIQESGSSGFGSHSYSAYENGNAYAHNWRTLNTSFNIKTTITNEKYKGSVLFESGFVNGYDYQKITNSDVGKQMKIGDYEFMVVDIINNSVILDFNTNIEALDFKLVNLNNEGQRIISSDGIFSSQTLFEDVYQLFKENPNVSFEEYKKKFHTRYVLLIGKAEKMKETKENIFGKKFLVFSTSGKLMNAYLYLPKYISKQFEVNYDENEIQHSPIAPKSPPSENKINLQFQTEKENAVLIGDNIELLDKDLNPIKTIETGIFVKTLGKTSIFYNNKKEDETCDGYKYIKINHQGKDYIVAGKNVFKLKKLDVQPKQNDIDVEFFNASSSDDYLQVLLPGAGFDFCYHLTFTPIIIYNIKSENFSFIEVIKEGDVYNKISSELKDASFFQSDTDLKNIETSKNGFILVFKDNLASFRVLLSQKNNNFTAKYIE